MRDERTPSDVQDLKRRNEAERTAVPGGKEMSDAERLRRSHLGLLMRLVSRLTSRE